MACPFLIKGENLIFFLIGGFYPPIKFSYMQD